jgi:hypothetical protein
VDVVSETCVTSATVVCVSVGGAVTWTVTALLDRKEVRAEEEATAEEMALCTAVAAADEGEEMAVVIATEAGATVTLTLSTSTDARVAKAAAMALVVAGGKSATSPAATKDVETRYSVAPSSPLDSVRL